MNPLPDRGAAESRFATVFEHIGFLVAYARRRGAHDPEALAAEAMAVAWRRLADVPVDDPRPWLTAVTRNLLLNDRRRQRSASAALGAVHTAAAEGPVSPELTIEPTLAAALDALSPPDREALLLVAWDDLTPSQAAASLGITPGAFRVRLHRARRRLTRQLTDPDPEPEAAVRNSQPSLRTEWRHS